MYVNQSHSVIPAGHACMLVFFPIKGNSGHLESHLPFGSLFSRFFVIVIQTREYNTHIENSNNRQDVCIDKFTNHFKTSFIGKFHPVSSVQSSVVI